MKKLGGVLLSIGVITCFVGAIATHQQAKEPKIVRADEGVRVIASDSDFADFKADLLTDEMVDQKIRLDADVNYEITSSLSSEKAFRGEFDGNGHSVTLSVSGGTFATIALFRCIGANGSILNVTTKGTISGSDHVAGIVVTNYGLMQNCINEANVSGTGQYVGGVAGVANSSTDQSLPARVINCENYGSVSSTYSGSSSLGLAGVVGYTWANVKIEHCSNFGTITSGNAFGTGGITGVFKGNESSLGDSYLTNCYNGGDVNANRYVGGILGHIDSSNKKVIHLSGCLNAGDITCSHTSTGYDGQLIGNGIAANTHFTLTDSAIIGKLTTTATSNVGQVIGKPASNTFNGVSVITTAGVSNNVKEVIKLVRQYDCENNATYRAALMSAVDNLTSDEETLLSSVTYWDKSESADRDYISDASYIIGNSPSSSRLFVLNKNNALLYVVVALAFASLSGLIAFLIIRKRKTNL